MSAGLEPTTYDRRLGLFDGTMLVIGGIIGAGIFLNPAIVAARTGSACRNAPGLGTRAASSRSSAPCASESSARAARTRAGATSTCGTRSARSPPFSTAGPTSSSSTAAGSPPSASPSPATSAASLSLPEIFHPAHRRPRARPSPRSQLVRNPSRRAHHERLHRSSARSARRAHRDRSRRGFADSAAPAAAARTPASAELTFGVLGAALIPVLFTYGGWQHSNHVAGEIRDPERNLPRALLLGVTAVVLVYMLVERRVPARPRRRRASRNRPRPPPIP